MKIKSIKKYEDNSRIVNVNFVTSMIENSQVSIGMKYFVIEWYSKSRMGYDVGCALSEESLVKELCDCASSLEEYKFNDLVDDIVKATPKFCYVYGNIWKYVLEYKYLFKKTVSNVESKLNEDINAYHGCGLYDLLDNGDRGRFEARHPDKVYKCSWNEEIYPTNDYASLNELLWKWFDLLTNGKYERINNTLYNKAKRAEEKLSVLKYKELSDKDLNAVAGFVQTQLDERGWYHNTGYVDVTTADGRKLQVTEVDTLELAISLGKEEVFGSEVNMIGDYLVSKFYNVNKLFNGTTALLNPVHYQTINNAFRKAVKMISYNENRFYEYNTPYGRLGYDIYDVSQKAWDKNIGSTMFITKVNDKSIQFITTDSFDFKETINEDDIEKRKLETELKNGSCSESFTFFKKITPKNRTKFTPEALMKDARDKAKKCYEDAVKRFGEPIVEQKTSEQELIEAASEAL